MAPTLTSTQRLRLLLTALGQEAALAAVVRGALAPLPAPRAAPPPAEEGVAALWRALDALPLGGRRESGFASTARVVKRDAWRKHADQFPGLAGRGATPAGWEEIDGARAGPDRAPLHALVRPPAPGRPIVLLVHGLYDSKRSRYLWIAAEALGRSGCGLVLPDMRWHGRLLSGDWLPTLGLAESLDLLCWARWAADRHPGHAVGCLGFSLGTLAVLHALAREEAAETLRAGGIAVSPPVVLERTARVLDAKPRIAAAGLDAFILDLFRRFLRWRMADLGAPDDPERPFARFLEWLSERLPEPPGGHGGGGVLALADPRPAIAASRRPLLLIASHDDPICSLPTAAERAELARGNPLVRLLATPGGGHIGHLGAYPAWMAEVLHLFFGWKGE